MQIFECCILALASLEMDELATITIWHFSFVSWPAQVSWCSRISIVLVVLSICLLEYLQLAALDDWCVELNFSLKKATSGNEFLRCIARTDIGFKACVAEFSEFKFIILVLVLWCYMIAGLCQDMWCYLQ